MITPVGIGLAQTAASVQADIARLRQTSFHDHRLEPIVVSHLPDDALPSLVPEVARLPISPLRRRLLQLATFPLQAALDGIYEPTPLFLGVHDPIFSEPSPDAAFLPHLAQQAGVSLDLK